MEEIAECIFDYDDKSYSENEARFKLCEDDYRPKEDTNPTENSSDIQKEYLSHETEKALQEKEAEYEANGQSEPQEKDSIQKDQTASVASNPDTSKGKLDSLEFEKRKEADMILRQLRDNIGEESPQKKLKAMDALYQAFDSTILKENRMPEYQKFFHRIFSDILITTNYDRALECCYPSLFSYSYKNLNESFRDKNAQGNEDEKNLRRKTAGCLRLLSKN